jgi:putative peptidoglycan lipid II flippase
MVRTVFNAFNRVSRSKQETILTAAGVIAAIFAVSAILGFIRNRLYSTYFGDSSELGVFFAADDIPTIVFSLIISGALSTSFIPVFNKFYKKDQILSWSLVSNAINISLALFIVFSAIVFSFSNQLVSQVVARNSNLTPEDLNLFATLLRILMLAQIGFIISSFYTSVLQSFNHFVIPALAPVMLNLGVIIFMVAFYKPLGIYAPAWGTVFGSILHMLVQIPFIREKGFRYSFIFDLKDKGVREVYKLMLPRTLAQTTQKLIIPLYTNLALYISGSANVILTFADDIQNVPVRLFGISIGQAALPIFASTYNEDDTQPFKSLITKTIYQVAFFILPVSVLVFILRVPLVRLAVGASKYPWEATVMTAYTLAFFSISFIAQSLVLVVSRAFYSMYDTKTPFKISLTSMVINAILAIIFVRVFGLGVWSLGLAFTISSFFNMALLLISLYKILPQLDETYELIYKINRISIASLIMGLTLYIPMKIFDRFIFDTTRTLDLILLTTVVTSLGLISFIFIVRFFKLKELDYIYLVLEKFKKSAYSLSFLRRQH